jgi:hypothetical protein
MVRQVVRGYKELPVIKVYRGLQVLKESKEKPEVKEIRVLRDLRAKLDLRESKEIKEKPVFKGPQVSLEQLGLRE